MSEQAVNVFRFERRAAQLSVCVSVALMGIKFTAYFITGSTAIFSDALESIVNVLASAFALYSIILAHAPADEQHPYGHGKVEFLAAGFEGGMIALAAVVIAASAIKQLYHGASPEQVDWGLILIAVAMIVNGLAGIYLIAGGRRHGSITLVADGKHLLTDAVTSAAVIAALGIVKITGMPSADPIGALCIAVYITWTAVGLLRSSAAGLMDEQDLADQRMIQQIIDSHIGPNAIEPRVCSYHKLRHRHSGRYHWVDFHLVVPGEYNIQRGHQIASTIEYEIERAIGEGNATAHVEPCTQADCQTCAAARTIAAAQTT